MQIIPRSDAGRWLVILTFGLVVAFLARYTNKHNEERYLQRWAEIDKQENANSVGTSTQKPQP